jgi:hypothetical protein
MNGIGTKEIWSSVPMGPEAKNNCAGEAKQQLPAMLEN